MNVFQKPSEIDEDIVSNLGPLAALVGIWEGDQGLDISPILNGQTDSKFRERITFEPVGPVVNGPQVLYGLRYATMAWPLHQENPFHEEVGYWLWDSKEQLVMRSFIVPRGVVVNAGGKADPEGKNGQFSYIEDTQLQIQGRQGVFHHTDQNALTRQS